MGFKLFSFSYSSYESSTITKIIQSPNPDPKNWKIIKVARTVDRIHIMVLVNYPDATNYEGNKLMILTEKWFEECQTSGILDPHFFPEKGPIVRLTPDQKGWELGLQILKML